MSYVYLNNHYTRWYTELTERARTRSLPENTLFESHHIVPLSLGGLDTGDNVVRLTSREHFIAHLLLVRMTTGQDRYKMVYAARLMSGRTKPTGRNYEWFRREFREAEKLRKKGHKRSHESIEKQRATVLSQYANGKVNNRKGSRLTDEHRQIISAANKGKTVPVEQRSSLAGYVARYGEHEGRQRYDRDRARKDSQSLEALQRRHGTEEGSRLYTEYREMKSRHTKARDPFVHTEESRAKLRDRASKRQRLPCPHCGTICAPGMLTRWHGDRCAKKPV